MKLNIEDLRKDYQTLTANQVCKKHKIKFARLRSIMARNSFKKKDYYWSKFDEHFVLTAYNTPEYNINDIAEKLGRTRYAVINKYRELKNSKAT